MAKQRVVYICQQCGHNAAKWQGRCPSCSEWNTFVEEVVEGKSSAQKSSQRLRSDIREKVHTLDSIAAEENPRISGPDGEFNRVLGGGIVPESLVLLGGEPGIGKSTLLLQFCLQMPGQRLLYVSGEESLRQIKLRSQRLGSSNPNLYLLAETDFTQVKAAVEEITPQILIIDSIQTLYHPEVESSPGSIPQIRGCTAELMTLAKQHNIAIFLIGHITKEGYIAGPKILEHMVDTVLYFEGDRHYNYRILRTMKNRFGSVSEIGIYEMTDRGLRPITNPSEILLGSRSQNLSGIAVAATMEGIRPMLIEVQGLVTPTFYGTPQRSTTGFDGRRLNMLLAVLEKRCGLRIGGQDIFLNIAGGLKVDDPASDLAVAAAIASSSEDMPITGTVCFAGEIGLSGEIRPVNQVESRISEAEKQGFTQIWISSFSKKNLTKKFKIDVKAAETVIEMLQGLND